MARKNNNLTGPGPGRPKGSLNKIPGDLKLAFMDTFEAIGGTDQLAEWAKKNLEAYYKIMSRLFPRSEVNVDVQQSQGLHLY